MANLYTKEVIVGMIYVVHVVKRNKKKSLFSCDSVVSLKSILFIFDSGYFVADYFIRRKQARIFITPKKKVTREWKSRPTTCFIIN